MNYVVNHFKVKRLDFGCDWYSPDKYSYKKAILLTKSKLHQPSKNQFID